jgi:hypothetical protein
MKLKDKPFSRFNSADKATSESKDAEKPLFEQYEKWLKDSLGIEISNGVKTQYEYITERIKIDFEKKSLFWISLNGKLDRYT